MLVCTTIIESGLDIPRANTMFVDRADRFGLAQLYQLRGRIGRSRERAYCYLLVPEADAHHAEAKQRLEVLQRFTELGAGFQIASHDLEIRGAGELLGGASSRADRGGRLRDLRADARGGGRRAAGRADPARARSRAHRRRARLHPRRLRPRPGPAPRVLQAARRRRATRTRCARCSAEIADRYGPLPDEVDAARRADDRQEARARAGRARLRARPRCASVLSCGPTPRSSRRR